MGWSELYWGLRSAHVAAGVLKLAIPLVVLVYLGARAGAEVFTSLQAASA